MKSVKKRYNTFHKNGVHPSGARSAWVGEFNCCGHINPHTQTSQSLNILLTRRAGQSWPQLERVRYCVRDAGRAGAGAGTEVVRSEVARSGTIGPTKVPPLLTPLGGCTCEANSVIKVNLFVLPQAMLSCLVLLGACGNGLPSRRQARTVQNYRALMDASD
ncbi:hypothetical protein J6590_002187 [Homalodisca vitripennis]|nr:hypothetical protein J6590_002187 [Homalodisca vitripennis]